MSLQTNEAPPRLRTTETISAARAAGNGPNNAAIAAFLSEVGSETDAGQAPHPAALRTLAAAVDEHRAWSNLWKQFRGAVRDYRQQIDGDDGFDADDLSTTSQSEEEP